MVQHVQYTTILHSSCLQVCAPAVEERIGIIRTRQKREGLAWCCEGRVLCYNTIRVLYKGWPVQYCILFFLTKLRYSGPLGSCTLPRAISNALLWYPSRPHAHHSNSTVQYPSYRTSSHVANFTIPFGRFAWRPKRKCIQYCNKKTKPGEK